MITIYTLQHCKYCSNITKYVMKYPSRNVCIIKVTSNDAKELKKLDSRFKSFPIAFSGTPKSNGAPLNKARMIIGSLKIMQYLKSINSTKNSFGFTGTSTTMKFNNNNSGNIKNINQRLNSCFNTGNTCHVMDRPFGPCDNAKMIHSNKFGNATPGTNKYSNEVNNKCNPMLIKEEKFNTFLKYPSKSKFGLIKKSTTTNSNLSSDAGSTTISRETGTNYIKPTIISDKANLYDCSYNNKNLKDTITKLSNQELLKNGINKFGKNCKCIECKYKKCKCKETKKNNTKKMVTPLGIEISFGK